MLVGVYRSEQNWQRNTQQCDRQIAKINRIHAEIESIGSMDVTMKRPD
jgi:hypothetical protein